MVILDDPQYKASALIFMTDYDSALLEYQNVQQRAFASATTSTLDRHSQKKPASGRTIDICISIQFNVLAHRI
jgi:carbamate kinase